VLAAQRWVCRLICYLLFGDELQASRRPRPPVRVNASEGGESGQPRLVASGCGFLWILESDDLTYRVVQRRHGIAITIVISQYDGGVAEIAEDIHHIYDSGSTARVANDLVTVDFGYFKPYAYLPNSGSRIEISKSLRRALKNLLKEGTLDLSADDLLVLPRLPPLIDPLVT
jgi:hypothetical protein